MSKVKAYRIETERLVVRCYHPKDALLLKKSVDESIEHLKPWMAWAKYEPESIEDKIERVRKFRALFDNDKDYVFGIFNKQETALIGGTGLHKRVGYNAREIGYWINVNESNKGYCYESTKALVKVGFEIENLDRIEIHVAPSNAFSTRIPEKLGFQKEGILKKRILDSDGTLRDKIIYTMFKESYLNNPFNAFQLKAFDCTDKLI